MLKVENQTLGDGRGLPGVQRRQTGAEGPLVASAARSAAAAPGGWRTLG